MNQQECDEIESQLLKKIEEADILRHEIADLETQRIVFSNESKRVEAEIMQEKSHQFAMDLEIEKFSRKQGKQPKRRVPPDDSKKPVMDDEYSDARQLKKNYQGIEIPLDDAQYDESDSVKVPLPSQETESEQNSTSTYQKTVPSSVSSQEAAKPSPLFVETFTNEDENGGDEEDSGQME